MIERPEDLKNGITVLLVTYNHAASIERSMRSVMSQKGVDGLKIVVADDASTDGTTEIVRRLAAEDSRIVHLVRERNMGVGPGGNSAAARKEIDTRYYALLEGDDHWCDEDKLHLQIEALQAHPECTFCAHQTEVRDAESKLIGTLGAVGRSGVCHFEDVGCTHPSSRVYRHPLLISPDFYRDFLTIDDVFCWDMSVQYAFLDRGPMWFIDKVMSVYNFNGHGIFSSRSPESRTFGSRKTAFLSDLYTGFRHSRFLRRFYLPDELADTEERFSFSIPYPKRKRLRVSFSTVKLRSGEK